MTAESPEQPNHSQSNDAQSNDIDSGTLLRSLRRKEGTWVAWGRACQALQKAGYSPQQIFEDTGFESVQQNQIVVATQVYDSMLAAGIPDAVRSHFEQRGSDTLYEFRILSQQERAAAACLVLEKGIDSEAARDVAKAIKEYSRRTTPPVGFAPFSEHPGDAIAYHYWRLARQQSNLSERSRLIAQGLKFASTESARHEIEALLTDTSVKSSRSAPYLPLYRMDSEEQLPRILPVVGKLPLSADDLKAVPLIEDEGPFRMVRFAGAGAWIPVPGWQVVWSAEDPVVILAESDQFPMPLQGKKEDVLVVIDRAKRQWNDDAYFIIEQDNQLQIRWFEDEPSLSLLGQVILILRPKKILDEDYTYDPWQIEE
ncbi:MAG: RuBisCO accumulation factor 1 [Elainellaceae cyanobacterium]